MQNGRIVQIIGAVVDVEFSPDTLPKIYDALLLRAAEKNPVERLYTFNLTEFKPLAPPGLQRILCAP